MAKKIYKYPLTIEDVQGVLMPTGAQVLCAQTQGGKPYLWAIVDPDLPDEVKKIRIVGTGHPMVGVNVERYIGTFQMADGRFVFHVFEAL